jgi:hypothetical protein
VRYLELADEGVFDERELPRRLFLGNVRQRKARRGQGDLPQLRATKKKKKEEERRRPPSARAQAGRWRGRRRRRK